MYRGSCVLASVRADGSFGGGGGGGGGVCVCVARHPSEGSFTCRRHWAFWRLSLWRFSALRVP